jgi:enoyl-CoA hydratase/carnithine racemase
MTPTSTVLTEVAGDTAYLTLHRPEKRNALARQVHHQLGAAIAELRERADVRFVVLRGSGGTFSSGGDLDELMAGLPDDYIRDYRERMRASVLALRGLEQVVVACVDGAAVGAGAALALAADLVVLETDARIRFTFGHVGFVPDAGTTLSLARAVGLPVTRDLLLTGRWVGAEEALARGLVARVAEPGGGAVAVEDVLEELRATPVVAAAMTKDLVEVLANTGFAAGVRTEGVYQSSVSHHPEHDRHLRARFGA